MVRCDRLLLPMHVVVTAAAAAPSAPQAQQAAVAAVQQVQYMSWYSYAGVVAASPGQRYANLAMNSDIGFLKQSYQQLNVSGMLVLQHSQWGAAIFAPPPWGGPYPGGLRAATWEGAVDDIVAILRPLPFIVGVMLGDELVCSGFPLSNLSALASRLRSGLRSRDVFIYTNECFPAGAPCKTDADCRGNSKQPGICATRPLGLPVAGCQAAVWPEMPSALDFISMDLYRAGAQEVTWTKQFYAKYLLPILKPHQRVFVVPGLFGPNGTHSNASATAATDASLVEKLAACLLWPISTSMPRTFNTSIPLDCGSGSMIGTFVDALLWPC